MSSHSLADDARSARTDGHSVLVARLPVAAPFNDARALPEWSQAITDIENEGWTLTTFGIGQDHVVGVQGICCSAGEPPMGVSLR